MPNLFIYTTPKDAVVVLTLDSGQILPGSPPLSANGRDDAHRIVVPPKTTGGAVLTITCTGYLDRADRGLVIPPSSASGEVHFQLDDVHMTPTPTPPVPPPRNPNVNPFDIIRAVYEQGDFDLGTKQGCGEYTEACCTALFTQQSLLWSHIRKTTAQNNWNGHAVDAIQLFAKMGETDPGIYDIVFDTESPNAAPAWSYKGPPDANLWYYGPMPCPPV